LLPGARRKGGHRGRIESHDWRTASQRARVRAVRTAQLTDAQDPAAQRDAAIRRLLDCYLLSIDNAAAEPNRSHDATAEAARQGHRESFGELLSVGLEYDWLRTGPWTSTIAFSFFGAHNNSLGSFDVDDYSGSLRVARRGTLFEIPMQAGFNYSYDYLTLGYDELVQRHSMAGYLALIESARHLTNFQARVEIKRYHETESTPKVVIPSELNQDATNWLVGAIHFVRFDRDRHFIKGGYQLDIEQAKGSDYSYVGHRFILGGQYTLPWRDIRLSYDFDLHYRDYLHRNLLLPTDDPGGKERNDREYTNTFRVEMPLTWLIKWDFFKSQSLFVTAEYTNKIINSNLDLYSYQRDYGALYFTWQY